MSQNLIEIFESQNGYLQAKQLTSRNDYYQLKKLAENGDVVKVKRGLFKHNQIATNSEWIEVSNIVPSGVICLFSAWQYHKLSTHIPAEYHIAIPNKSKVVLPPFPPIKLYYWGNNYFSFGKITKGEISIYSIEKSVCDAVRFRNKVGKDIVSEVLKNYLSRNDRNIDLLLKLSKDLRIEEVLKQYLDVML